MTVIRIIDVGGQRSERRKWLNALSDVHVVMFVVAGSGISSNESVR